MSEGLQTPQSLLQDSAGNAPQGLVVAILVLIVILVALSLIVFALPARRRRRSAAGTEPSDAGGDAELSTRAWSRHTPRWVVAAVFITIVAAGAVGSTLIWYESTSSDEYCTRMCHAMAEPSETWANSAHAGVSCTRCHEGRPWVSFGPAVRSRSYSLYLQLSGARAVHAPVPAENCLECHGDLLDTEMIARNGESFTHREVLATRPDCAECHGQQGHEPPRPKPQDPSEE